MAMVARCQPRRQNHGHVYRLFFSSFAFLYLTMSDDVIHSFFGLRRVVHLGERPPLEPRPQVGEDAGTIASVDPKGAVEREIYTQALRTLSVYFHLIFLTLHILSHPPRRLLLYAVL